MTLPDGVQVTADLDADPELAGLVEEVLTTDAVAFLADLHRRDDATSLYREMALFEDFADFLTLPAYERMR